MTNPPPPQQPLPGSSASPNSGQYSPYGQPPGLPPRPKRADIAGISAVLLVAAALVIQVAQSIITAGMIGGTNTSFEIYGLLMGVIAVVQALLALAAVIIGAVGLAGRGRPKALAGIGVGGGAVLLFGLLSSQLTNVLVMAFRG